ncbi:hypothetical protein PPYR_01714 [Photinus pyralis]|uniref:Uncharacterized protein n=1 Tax=Photinus pyralis TaxID=7054 RepID=A0A1Y1KR38_PHOPY|nr:uncharacterized protein LOC116181566 [Photinus pyralis]KAB0804744.1 hypothetical protein PPYR_01714 [Photinus pyralis]
MYKVLIILTLHAKCMCEWIEIPQQIVMSQGATRKMDYAISIFTTTSTTTQRPIFPKPFIAKPTQKTNLSNHRHNYNDSSTSNKSPDTEVVPTTVTVSFRENQRGTKKRKTTTSTKPKIVSNVTNSGLTEDTFLNPNLLAHRSGFDDLIQNDEYSYTSFIPYLSRVQYDLMKNAHKNKESKWNVLQNLRDHLLIEIEKRISQIGTKKAEGRGARDFKDHDSHVDFPSNESALITIGFLTFAVFLIKIVMHLIQTLGTTTTTTSGRKRREVIDNDDVLRILQHVEQFTLK